MSYYVVDVEADGPVPPNYSMVCFGAVLVDEQLDKTFYGQTKPISSDWVDSALAISGFTREEHIKFPSPEIIIPNFVDWVDETNQNGRPIFITDNLAFDWQWMNYYLFKYVGTNPFGYSGRRIGDIYCGLMKNSRARWKHLRKTKHTHNPVDDAKGNAEAILHMKNVMGLSIKL